jgi:hypothetical protein
MRKIVGSVGILALLLAVAARAGEFEPVKPGPEHKKFKDMVGTWDAKCESRDKEGKEKISKGTMTYQTGLGDLWLFEHFKGELDGKSFEGKGAMSYDPARKVYVSVWVDSMTASPMVSEGNYDKAGRLVMKGEMPTPDGKKLSSTMISEMTGKNTMVMTMSCDISGKTMEMMKVTLTRRNK